MTTSTILELIQLLYRIYLSLAELTSVSARHAKLWTHLQRAEQVLIGDVCVTNIRFNCLGYLKQQ